MSGAARSRKGNMGIQGPATRPCESCPYRRDVPAGIWAATEYAKLPEYDQETMYQPSSVFMCHQNTGRMCAGWVGCHDTDNLLALRIAASRDDISLDVYRRACVYVSPVPLFASGAEAAAHGLSDIEHPDPEARHIMYKILRKRRDTRH